MGPVVGPAPHERRDTSVPSRHARTQGEGGRLRAGERALATDGVCTWILDFRPLQQ